MSNNKLFALLAPSITLLLAAFAGRAAAEQVTVNVNVSYTSIQPNDRKYDDVFGSVSFNNRTYWDRSSSRRVALYKGQTLNFGSTTFNVETQPGSVATLRANLMDYDSSSPNDVIGTWNTEVDLGEAVVRMKQRNQNSIRLEYWVRGEDFANGTMYIDITRR